MSRKLALLFSLLVILALMLVACGGGTAEETAEPAANEAAPAEEAAAPTEAPAEEMAPAEQTVTIGFTASQTGNYNVESTRQINGLNLWMDQANAAGVTLADGTVLKFESVFYDDESNTDRVQELYTRLATD
ncbi:MAG: hypothetical protein ACK2UH_07050, partial [Candidatus Promineifilaceae bacterium]